MGLIRHSMSRPRKKTSNPATDRQKRIVSRLLNLLVDYEVYQTMEDAQQEFSEQVGYSSIKEISTLNAVALIKLYSSLLRGSINNRKQWRRIRSIYYDGDSKIAPAFSQPPDPPPAYTRKRELPKTCIVCHGTFPPKEMEPLSKKEPFERDVPSNTCRGCWQQWEERRAQELPAWLEKWHRDAEKEIEDERLREIEQKAPNARAGKAGRQ